MLDSTRALIAERGLDGLTVRDLARASAVSVPTLYSLFPSKDALVFAAVVERFAQIVAQGAPPVERGLGRVLRTLDLVAREVSGAPDYVRSLAELLLARADAHELRRTLSEAFTREVAEGLDEMRAAGELVPWVEPRTLAERIESHAELTALAWSIRGLDDDSFQLALPYGTCLLLLGVARGAARAALEGRVTGAR